MVFLQIYFRSNSLMVEKMNTVAELTPREYYRLPWSLTDNAISWLEVTDDCNLECEGCYRPHLKNHKSLAQIAEELAVFKARRKSDCMSIAGGDPLVHPQIVEIVKMVKDGGWKPIINTNGLALGKKLLKKLKEAGAYGFTFHIDTTQVRSDSKADNENEHNALRLKFAQMLADEGGLACSFNQTVSVDTLDQVKDSMAWAQQHPDIVHTMVFILFRTPELFGDFEVHANGMPVDITNTMKSLNGAATRMVKAKHVVAKIQELDADYQPCALPERRSGPQFHQVAGGLAAGQQEARISATWARNSWRRSRPETTFSRAPG